MFALEQIHFVCECQIVIAVGYDLAAAPEIAALRWRQYTPYFNDGEPCTFSVNDLYAKNSIVDYNFNPAGTVLEEIPRMAPVGIAARSPKSTSRLRRSSVGR